MTGPSLSNDAIAVLNEVSDPFHLPLVTFSATSAALSSPTQYPYFLRINPTRSGLCYTYARLIRLFGGANRKVRAVWVPMGCPLRFGGGGGRPCV